MIEEKKEQEKERQLLLLLSWKIDNNVWVAIEKNMGRYNDLIVHQK